MVKKLKDSVVYIFLTIISLLSIAPFLWMVIGASNKSKDVTLGKLTFGSNLIENFKNLSEQADLKLVFWNSARIAILTTILAILISSLAGYGFEIFKSRKKELLFRLLLVSMMLPFAAMMIPLFKMFSNFGLLNKDIAIILPGCASAFLIFFFRQNTKSFPKELIEAARVDGLNEFSIFFRIYMPTMKSTYAAAGIITFMSTWNNYLWPLIVLQTPNRRTLPLVISTLASSYTPDYGMMMMGVVISVIPTVLIFFLLQKQFVEGMVGSVK